MQQQQSQLELPLPLQLQLRLRLRLRLAARRLSSQLHANAAPGSDLQTVEGVLSARTYFAYIFGKQN